MLLKVKHKIKKLLIERTFSKEILDSVFQFLLFDKMQEIGDVFEHYIMTYEGDFYSDDDDDDDDDDLDSTIEERFF
jgi:hypothetical protein